VVVPLLFQSLFKDKDHQFRLAALLGLGVRVASFEFCCIANQLTLLGGLGL
jgi:hypothetical protein